METLLDHVFITVKDLDRSIAFYETALRDSISVEFDEVQGRQRSARKLLQPSASRQAAEINCGESNLAENVALFEHSAKAVRLTEAGYFNLRKRRVRFPYALPFITKGV